MTAPRVYVVAGEPSGDRLGAALIEAMGRLAPGLRFTGLGGPQMAAAGFRSLFDINELSVMGIVEVLPRLPSILRRIREVAADVERTRPDLLLTIDSPSFSLRVAARAKARLPNLPVCHYVAPSVWAWRPGRAAKMAAHVDHVLALLPFEPPYMTAAGMGCDFVGHPAAERPVPDRAMVEAFRAHAGIGDARLLLVAPGSRSGEVSRLGPVFLEVARRLRRRHPGLAFAVPLAETVADAAREMFAPLGDAALFLEPEAGEARKRLAMAAADAALAASGTVALELAAAGTPLVACYRAQPLTAAIVRQLIRVETANLVNLVSGTRVVPEFLQETCRAELILPVVEDLLEDGPGAAEQRRVMAAVMEQLGRAGPPPSERAARAVLGLLDQKQNAM